MCDNSYGQNCSSISSTEAELVAIQDCAIEFSCLTGLLSDLEMEACTDKKVRTIYATVTLLCLSRHVDRKVFKMRELRGTQKNGVQKHLKVKVRKLVR